MASRTENWREYWKRRDAWSVREFAQLCCGWNPSVYEFPDRDLYNEAVDSINRAARVKVLPVIDDLAWPETGAERMYDMAPAFRPKDVVSWAVRQYSGQFPFSTDDWAIDELDSRERTTLLAIIGVLCRVAKISLEEKSKAAGIIGTEAKAIGVRLNQRTIETHLGRIADAIERRAEQ